MFNFLYNPLSWIAIVASVVVGMLVFAAICHGRNPHRAKKWRIYAKRTTMFAGFWLLFCCTPLFAMFLSLDVEERFPEWKIEHVPEADAILLPGDIAYEHLNEAAIKVGQLLAAKKSGCVSFLSASPAVIPDVCSMQTSFPADVVVPLATVDYATTNKILLVSNVWDAEKDCMECRKIFTNAMICPVAYGHLMGNRTCNEMHISDFLPSPRGVKLVAQTLKNLLAS